MKDYEPGMSFGEEVAEAYDDAPRGDEAAAVAFLEGLEPGAVHRQPQHRLRLRALIQRAEALTG